MIQPSFDSSDYFEMMADLRALRSRVLRERGQFGDIENSYWCAAESDWAELRRLSLSLLDAEQAEATRQQITLIAQNIHRCYLTIVEHTMH